MNYMYQFVVLPLFSPLRNNTFSSPIIGASNIRDVTKAMRFDPNKTPRNVTTYKEIYNMF